MCDDWKLYIRIQGVDMQLELWGLTRLFINENRIVFFNDENHPEPSIGSLLITLTVYENTEIPCVETCLYKDINDLNALNYALSGCKTPDTKDHSEFASRDKAMIGARILKNVKIICGTSLYHVLSKVFNKELPYGSLIGVRPVKLATRCLEDGLDEISSIEVLQRTTGMSREKARLLISVAGYERFFNNEDNRMVNLYIGIPFCAGRCLYCSFTSYPIDRFKNLVGPYLDSLSKELEFGLRMIRKSHLKINAIYLGGGTPTSLPEESLMQLLFMIRDYFTEDCKEFTVEAGRPDTINMEKLLLIKESGATRISINPQSMNPETLALIGRNHTPDDIVDKFMLARELGFDNINMDIIAGLPGENFEMFQSTLNQVEILKPDNMTVHTMAFKRASRLISERELFPASDDDVVEKMIEAARLSAHKMGMSPYYLYRQKNILANLENTGYASQGKACRYNIQTMSEKQSVIAFGAGSISKYVDPEKQMIKRDDNVKDVTQYINRIDEMIDRKTTLFKDLGE